MSTAKVINVQHPSSATINGVTSFVPLNSTNTDCQKIMQLVAEGKLTIASAEGA